MDYLAAAVQNLRRRMREFEVVGKSSPVRDPNAYDIEWKLRLARDVYATVALSYAAGKGIRVEVTEKRPGKVTEILDEKATRVAEYERLITSCLPHWYDRVNQPSW